MSNGQNTMYIWLFTKSVVNPLHSLEIFISGAQNWKGALSRSSVIPLTRHRCHLLSNSSTAQTYTYVVVSFINTQHRVCYGFDIFQRALRSCFTRIVFIRSNFKCLCHNLSVSNERLPTKEYVPKDYQIEAIYPRNCALFIAKEVTKPGQLVWIKFQAEFEGLI